MDRSIPVIYLLQYNTGLQNILLSLHLLLLSNYVNQILTRNRLCDNFEVICNLKNINLRSMIVYFATPVKFIVTARAMANCHVVKLVVLCVDPTGDCAPKNNY